MFELNTVSVQNESTQFREIWNWDLFSTSLKKFITEESMKAEDTHEINLSSEILMSSKSSITSCESHLIQWKSWSMLSIYCAKNISSSHQFRHDIRYFIFADSAKSVQYEIWDSQSQLSALTEVEFDLKSFTWKMILHYNSFNNLFTSIWLNQC